MNTTNRGETQRMNLDPQCSDVFLLEFTRQMTLDESSLRITVSICSVQAYKAVEGHGQERRNFLCDE
jgi:hypothetical protein